MPAPICHRYRTKRHSKMKNNLLLFSLLILVSCQPIMMKLYGIKDPDIENEKTITKKALNYDLDTSNIVTVKGKFSKAYLP